MSEFWHFAGEHWFLMWCALWLVWGAFFVAYVAIDAVFRLINRLLRTIKVMCRGWPPEHLDADGDWKPQGENDGPRAV